MKTRELVLSGIILLLLITGCDTSINYYGGNGEAPVIVSPKNYKQVISTQPVFIWNEVYGTKSYIIQIGKNESFSYRLIEALTSETFYTATLLSPSDTCYFWRVKAIFPDGRNGQWSEKGIFYLNGVIAVSTPGANPTPVPFNAPAIIYPKNKSVITERSPLFDWNETEGATSYQFQLDKTREFNSTILTYSVLYQDDSHIKTHLNLDLNRTYYWRVRAIKSGGVYSPWTETHSFTIGETASTGEINSDKSAAPVVTFPANNSIVTNTIVTFDWQDLDNVDEYQLEFNRYPDFSQEGYMTAVPIFDSRYDYPIALTNYSTYFWRVRARYTDGTYTNWTLPHSFTVKLSR